MMEKCQTWSDLGEGDLCDHTAAISGEVAAPGRNCQASLAGSGVAYIPIRELWQVTHELSITPPHQCLPLRGLCPPRVSAL